ncbi:MAG: hypothetical protein FWE46_06955, partial [Coriobacteriia bacterium]|nr:hypothetical protein [Coriobacteriia bacterium]
MPARTAADTALAADSFVEEWSNRGQEDQDTHSFWLNFLQDIMGISRAHHVINFEKRVRIGRSTKRIDAYIADSRVLIEQKSADIDLDAPQRQSDGVELTPYQQAQRYAQNLPPSETPLYIIVCNFKTFHIYDRENDPQGNNPIKITLEELPAQLPAFRFMTEPIEGVLARQEQANLEAARLIGDIYNAVKHQYDLVHPSQTDAASAVDPTSATTESCTRHDLAILMVRLLFCLYAEDSGLFDQRLFYDYLLRIEPGQGAFR